MELAAGLALVVVGFAIAIWEARRRAGRDRAGLSLWVAIRNVAPTPGEWAWIAGSTVLVVVGLILLLRS